MLVKSRQSQQRSFRRKGQNMKLAIELGPPDDEWETHSAYALEAERLGIDFAWSPELWGYDAVTPLAYLAAKTSRIHLGTGIMQIGARTPAMIAMTAMTMSALSQNRFVLGLGGSGPQVMEGWHGVPFARPLQGTREVIDIVRMIARGERLTYTGEIYHLPLPGGEGKALVSIARPRPNLPIIAPRPILLAVASRNRRRRGSRCLRVLNARHHGSSPVRFCELNRGEIGAHARAE